MAQFVKSVACGARVMAGMAICFFSPINSKSYRKRGDFFGRTNSLSTFVCVLCCVAALGVVFLNSGERSDSGEGRNNSVKQIQSTIVSTKFRAHSVSKFQSTQCNRANHSFIHSFWIKNEWTVQQCNRVD